MPRTAPHRPALALLALIALLTLALLTLACGAEPDAGPTPSPPEPPPAAFAPTVALDASAAIVDPLELDRAARLLAGMPLPDGAAPPEHPEIWQRHAQRMEATWSELEARYVDAISRWSDAELASIPDPEATLFYPFGGPDLLNAVSFFPQARAYVLGGLEPPGRLPEVDGLDPAALEAELARLHSGLRNVAEAGYFVTKQMEEDFTVGRFDGLLPVLYIFLARTGHTPVEARYVAVGEDGAIQELAEATPTAGGAARILFRRGDEETPRALFYFSRDVSNAGLASHPEFLRYVERLAPFNVYMKSASYLLHMPEFSDFRHALHDGARTVLQDDSGFPLRTLDAATWDLRFYGVYTKTLAAYRQWLQDDLLKIYRERKDIPPLEFAIGYHHRIGGGCLILASRRES